MKKAAALCLLLLLLVLPTGAARGEAGGLALGEIEQKSADAFSCRFDGVKHSFLLALPERPEGAPLILLLPGYGNTAEAMRTQTHFDGAATARGYAVAYVTGAPDPAVPSSSVGWHYECDTPGNRDGAFLGALAAYLQERCGLDRERAFVVGFSNGAFMAQRLAAEADGRFRAFVSVAGAMPASVWNARRESSAVGVFQITGEKDEAIPKNLDGSARYAKAPAIEDVMAYWVSANGLEERETGELGRGSVLTRYTSPEKPQQVWELWVKAGRHSWPSEAFHHFDLNALILDFFEAQG